ERRVVSAADGATVARGAIGEIRRRSPDHRPLIGERVRAKGRHGKGRGLAQLDTERGEGLRDGRLSPPTRGEGSEDQEEKEAPTPGKRHEAKDRGRMLMISQLRRGETRATF